MIAGFEQPTEGEILLAGQPIAGVPPYRRNVNTVFQHYALFPHMNVAQNVGYGLRQKKVGKDEERRRVGEALELVRLGGYERAPDVGAVGRPAAARRARPGPRQPADRAPPRRAARRARPQAAQGDAARAEGPPAGGRDHVRVRDPRPGGGPDDERHHRRHARRPDPAAWAARRSSTSGRSTVSSRTSSASRTPSPGTVAAVRLGDTAWRRSSRTAGLQLDGPHDGPRRRTRRRATRSSVAVRPERLTVEPATDGGASEAPGTAPRPAGPGSRAGSPRARISANRRSTGSTPSWRASSSSAARTHRRERRFGLGPGDPVVVRWHEDANLVLVG